MLKHIGRPQYGDSKVNLVNKEYSKQLASMLIEIRFSKTYLCKKMYGNKGKKVTLV